MSSLISLPRPNSSLRERLWPVIDVHARLARLHDERYGAVYTSAGCVWHAGSAELAADGFGPGGAAA